MAFACGLVILLILLKMKAAEKRPTFLISLTTLCSYHNSSFRAHFALVISVIAQKDWCQTYCIVNFGTNWKRVKVGKERSKGIVFFVKPKRRNLYSKPKSPEVA